MNTFEFLEYYFKSKEEINYVNESFNRIVTINIISKEIKDFFMELNNSYGEEMVKEALEKLEDEENE